MNCFNRPLLYLIAAAVMLLGAAALAGHPVVPVEVLSTLGAVPFMVGDTGNVTLADINKEIEKLGRAWEEHKKTNEELLKAKADGKAIGDLETKLARIAADLDKISEAKSAMESTLAKMQRGGLAGGQGDKDIAVEVKAFNNMRAAFASVQGKSVAEIDQATYVAYKSAFFSLVRGGDKMLTGEEVKALQAGVDSDGGYLLPASTVGKVIERIHEISPVRAISSVQTITTDALEGINDLEESSYGWVAETGARTTTNTPGLGKYRIEAHEMYASPKATQKLLDDAGVDVESWLANKVARKFARAEGEAFCTGSGVGRPRGITKYTTAATADSTRAWGQLEHVLSGASADFAATTPADKLFELVGKFKQAYLQNASWVTTREVITKVRKFKEATTNAYIWQPGLQAGQPEKLLGYPVVIAQDMPALAADSLSMAFGDFRAGYQIVDRMGIRTLRDPYTDKPYVVFYSTKRVGGGVVDFDAIKFIKFNA